jgi:hypothetical protein
MGSEPTRLAKPRPSTYTQLRLRSPPLFHCVFETLETLSAAAAAGGTASGSSRRSHPVKEKRGKRQEPAQMDSGSDSDGAPEELTAVQVPLVLSPLDPTRSRCRSRLRTIRLCIPLKQTMGRRADSPVRVLCTSVSSSRFKLHVDLLRYVYSRKY